MIFKYSDIYKKKIHRQLFFSLIICLSHETKTNVFIFFLNEKYCWRNFESIYFEHVFVLKHSFLNFPYNVVTSLDFIYY